METDESGASVDPAATVTSPLLSPLDRAQVALLDAIWRPVMLETTTSWPTWDYVSRQLFQLSEPVLDANEVFESLPTVHQPELGTYGLVWNSEGSGEAPRREDRIGLSIAGLLQLGGTQPTARDFANSLASFIEVFASYERNITSGPDDVAEAQTDITMMLNGQTARSRYRTFAVRPETIVHALLREYARPHIQSENGQWIARLVPWLRSYLGVVDADDYITRITVLARIDRPLNTGSPLTLAQSLDYLSVVLSQSPKLGIPRLVGSASAASFARLSLDVAVEADFKDRMAAFADVLGHLAVPPVEGESLDAYGGSQPGSLERLWSHLRPVVDPSGLERLDAAIKDLKAGVKIRSGAMHTDVAVRRDYRLACGRLGIAWPIRAWPTAWDTVRARASFALDAIREEVQLSP